MRARPLMMEHVVPEEREAASWFSRHLPALLILAGLSVLLTWPLLPHIQNTLISWGDPVFQTWTLSWNWHALRTDPLAIFDANVFYPWRNALAYSDHLIGQTILVLPVLAVTGNGILANNISVLLALFLSGLAMYLLVYDITGNRVAAILAGGAYAFAPMRMAHLEHLHLLTGQWPPLALLCLRRTTITTGGARRWWTAGLGAVFFAQGLSGIYFLYYTVVMLLIVGIIYLVFAVRDRNREMVKAVGLSAGACAIAGILLLPVLLPYLEVRNDLGIEREPEEVSFWSAKSTDYLAVSPNNRLYNGPLGEYHRDVERDLFPGLMLVGLAVAGLFNRRSRIMRWALLAITVGGYLLSLGLTRDLFGYEITLPYRIFYDYLPGFRALRVPARFGFLGLVGLGGLAGLGIDQLWRWIRPRVPDAWHLSVGAAAVAIGLAILWAETVTMIHLPEPLPVDNSREDYAYIAEHQGPIIELPMGDGPVASAWPNFWSTKHWNQVANGYSGLLPPTYDLLRERSNEFPSPETISLFQGVGIETVLIHKELPADERAALEAQMAEYPQLKQVLSGQDSVYMLEANPWMWELVEAVPDDEKVDLPHVAGDPLAYGLIVAILQREGHIVSGDGEIGYYELPAASSPRCHLILDSGDNPAAYGYPETEPLLERAGYVLYRNTGCV